ncbi:unnamed protein product [Parajaminaea phylloscopi]
MRKPDHTQLYRPSELAPWNSTLCVTSEAVSMSSSLLRSLRTSVGSHSFSPLLRSSTIRSFAMAPSVEASMRQKLTAEFSPQTLNIRNDSAKHAHHAAMVAQGGGSGETHFFVDIVSAAFEGKTQIARHRAVNSLLSEEFDAGLHALSLRTKTPAEVEKEQSRRA